MLLTRHLILLALAALAVSAPALSQPWPTTDWVVRPEDSVPLSGDRIRGAGIQTRQLVGASHWYQSMGFRAPEVFRVGEREGGPLGPYIALMKPSLTDEGAVYTGESREIEIHDAEGVVDWLISGVIAITNPARTLRISGARGSWEPQNAGQRLMSAGPAHELFHGIQAAYGTLDGAPRVNACQGEGDSMDWLVEGSASAAQIRWIERASGARYEHTFRDPSRFTWARYYDHSLHRPENRTVPGSERSNLSWVCGYGTWYFWYAAGEMVGRTPEQQLGYLKYVFGGPNRWSDYGVANLDAGLIRAAQTYGTPDRYDGGLYEVYPEFIAQYVDDVRHFEAPEAVNLRSRSEVVHRRGAVEPLAAKAVEVHVHVPEGAVGSSRVRITLERAPNRDQLHLIEGQRVIRRPGSPEDPYEVEIAVPRDTTLLVRVANVAPEAASTTAAAYDLRVEVGGFYGASASVGDIPGIPPGFTVISGPPSLLGCRGTIDGGSVFDLVTADEAVADIRRAPDKAEAVAEDALRRMEAMGMDVTEMRTQLRQTMEEAATDPGMADVQAETAREFSGRSRLEATFVGQTATGKTCQIFLHATLAGEQGGFQTISTAREPDPDEENPVGIENVSFLAGSMQDMIDEPFEICMMTDEERRDAAMDRCPMVCDVGTLSLERAGQNHVQGLFRASVFSVDYDQASGEECPATQVLPFIFSFNIATADEGQDAEVLRSMSDEMLRLIGATEREIDALREFD